MEETELEEGEACFDDNDASIGPDTALSYIDQRLQNVLGHFQKDFEDGMCPEILGPKFGGYGSFLPSQKQVPTVRSQIKTQMVQSSNKSSLQAAPLNLITPTEPVLAVRPPAKSSFHVSKIETTTSNSENPSKQRSLKVRFKVGSDKSARKNAAIYSGLGLSSSSSSMGNDHEDSDGPLIEANDISLDSLGIILHDMTSTIVPGNRLLSPLNESLLCLTKMERIRENKPTPLIMGRKIGFCSNVDDSSSILGERKPMEGKEVSSQVKSETEGIIYKESTSFEAVKALFLRKDMEKESSDSKQCLTNDLKVNLRSESLLCKESRAAKIDVRVRKRETHKEWTKDQFFSPDFKDSEAACGQDHDVKRSSSEETKTKTNTKKLSLDSKGSDRAKGKTVHSVCKSEPDVSKLVEEKVGPKDVTREPHDVKAPHGITKMPLERKSKLMCIQTGAMKDKKSAQKDIVKVRNSYKDILDARVIDENTQRRESKMPTGNLPNHCDLGVVKENHIPINGLVAESADPLRIQAAPEESSDIWVGCDRCQKWRLLPIGIGLEDLPDKWLCSMSTWLPERIHCDISEEETTKAVHDMNLHLMLQNENTVQYNGPGATSGLASDNIRHSEAMPNRLKKNNSRREGSSHLSEKRKSLSEANQPLVEKNMVNKSNSFAMGRHAAKVNGKDVNEGDLKPKKLKCKTGSEAYDSITSSKIKTEAAPNTDGYRDRLVISVKRQTESTELSMKSKLLGTEKVKIHVKKRKLKDWEESSQPSESNDRIGRKEKRLKASNTEINNSTAIKEDDRSALKGKTMKIIFPGSKENSVDLKQDKHREKGTTSRKNLELAATSSSSKVSDSCRRASLLKGSPVGSVSSTPTRALNLDNLSPSVRTISRKSGKGTQIPRKLLPREDNVKGISVIDASQRFGGKVELKHKEAFKIMEDNANGAMIPQSSGKESLTKSREKDKNYNFQRVKVKGFDPLTKQEPFPNKTRKVEVDVDRCRSSMNPEYSNDSSTKISNDDKGIFGKKISRRRTTGITEDESEKPTSVMDHCGYDAKLSDMGSSEVKANVKKELKKVYVGDISKKRDITEVQQKVEGGNLNVKSVVNDCGTVKDLGVISFVKEYASSLSQTAMTAFKRAEESKDYADRIKISGVDYECNDAYFDSALKFLYAASLLEACSIDFNKPKGVDPVNVYSTSAKLSKTCAQEYEKRKEMAAATLAYKCMEVAYMRIVYCKSSVTRQDLQTSSQMVNQGESPSSSASDVDNLNNQATMDKAVLSKTIAYPGNHLVARNQANFLRLLDFTSDVNLAMEASTNTQNSYKAATSITQESPNKEMINSIKRVVGFSFQDVKEVVFLVQNAREAINHQGFKGKNRE